MKPIERTALTFTFIWTLFDAFAPGAPYHERIHFTLITTFGIAYLYGVHVIWFHKIKSIFFRRTKDTHS